jgi:NAD(P)-dependent dehydrogenase (short-subunit alcohol dehydrogenase family)
LGVRAVVTGASAGIGLAVAKGLALLGADVVLACRDPAKGHLAVEAIAGADVQRGRLDVVQLDLASLASVRAAAAHIRSLHERIDLLINNAGVMEVPFALTEDGFELTFATNHLGHFALTGLLLDHVLVAPAGRVVTVSSNAHRRAVPVFDLPATVNSHDPGAAYARSKLANLLFTFELQRRLSCAGLSAIALAAHPGNARTNLWRTSSRMERALIHPRLRLLTGWLVQSPAAGALPVLRAATDVSATGGEYFGPSGRGGYTGSPELTGPSPATHDREAQLKLWSLSERLTGVSYNFSSTDRG